MKVAIRVDASVQMGIGHFARCLTLADLLRARGMSVCFLSRSLPATLAAQIASHGHDLVMLPTAARNFVPAKMDVAHAAWLTVPQAQDAAESLSALPEAVDILIVDHYGIDYRWHQKMRARAGTIFVIDDLADRKHDCDLLLDQNLQQGGANRYVTRIPTRCKTLLGTRYAMLRPEFSAPPVRGSYEGRRLNVFFGGTDPVGGTLFALGALSSLCQKGIQIDVVAGGANPHIEAIRAACAKLASVTLYVQTDAMVALFTAADLAVGAGGSAALERCSRALPQILTSFADNQRPSCEEFASAGAAMDLGPLEHLSAGRLRDTVTSLLAAPERRAAMGAAGRGLVDGNGADRVAAHVEQMARAAI